MEQIMNKRRKEIILVIGIVALLITTPIVIYNLINNDKQLNCKIDIAEKYCNSLNMTGGTYYILSDSFTCFINERKREVSQEFYLTKEEINSCY